MAQSGSPAMSAFAPLLGLERTSNAPAIALTIGSQWPGTTGYTASTTTSSNGTRAASPDDKPTNRRTNKHYRSRDIADRLQRVRAAFAEEVLRHADSSAKVVEGFQ